MIRTLMTRFFFMVVFRLMCFRLYKTQMIRERELAEMREYWRAFR